MRIFFICLVFFFIGIWALFPVPSRQERAPMPWEATIMEDGNTQVFGIHLGETTFEQAQLILNGYGKTALFSQPNHEPTVEAYFDNVNLGGLSAKVVLNLMASEQQMQAMLDHATTANLRSGGARRYELHSYNTSILHRLPIMAITYIPSIILSQDMVIHRFGKAEDIQQMSNQLNNVIWHYHRLSLSITFNGQEKTVLQYRMKN